MEIKEVVSVGKSNQSMESKEICILVVNDDLTCNNIVAEMLQHCSHEVLHIGGVLDVLNAIWESKESLDLVLTNAHKLESNGIEIVQHIQKKLNLPIILMCPDKMKIVFKGHAFSFAAYVLKGLSKNDVNNLWQFALQKEKLGHQEEDDSKRPSIVETNKTCSSRYDCKRRTRERGEESKEEHHPHMAKKPRVVWTIDMHQKFLEAIEILGYEKAVPKKIVEVMGIPGLTRENVASHLQKFRGSIRRTQEAKELEAIRILPSSSTSTLTSLPRNTYTSTVQDKFCLGTTSETHNCMFLGGLRFPKDFRTYGDHEMKNMVMNMNKTTSFVGYRLTSDGNSIEYGNIVEAKTDDQDTASIQALGNATLPQNPSGNDTLSSSAFPRVQNFSIPPLEITRGDDRTVQTQTGLLEGLSQGHYSPPQMRQYYLDDLFDLDDDLVKGTGGSCNDQFEWQEFDDTLFKNDD